MFLYIMIYYIIFVAYCSVRIVVVIDSDHRVDGPMK